MSKSIPITDNTVIDRTPSRQLGPQILSMPEGDALCTDADSLTAIVAQDPETGELFAMVIAIASHEGVRLGSLSPMTAAQARNFAASLYETANQVDSGLGVS